LPVRTLKITLSAWPLFPGYRMHPCSWLSSAILASVWLATQLDKPGDARLRSICESRLKQIMIAVHNYHTDNECFPLPFKTNDSGKRIHSWQMVFCRNLDQQELYDRFKLNEPWVSPHHREAATADEHFAQARLQCPTESGVTSQGSQTSCFAIVGPRSVWQADSMVRLQDITDRTAGTMCIFESARSGVHWIEPRDRFVGQISLNIKAAYGQKNSSDHDSTFVFDDTGLLQSSVTNVGDGWDGSIFASLNFQRTSKTADCGRRWIAAAKMGGLF